jgi:S-adenosylmethionine hydrolase
MARGVRPVIGFLTDFGLDGAAATCRGVMIGICPHAQIIDISHTVAKYAIRDGAYVLRASLPYLPVGVHLAVIDPGVGTERRPIAISVARGDVLIGPDNGLLTDAAEALGGIGGVRQLTNARLWRAEQSATFHARDIFAPVAAHLAAGDSGLEDVGPAIPEATLVRLAPIEVRATAGELGTAIVYVDSFGNARLAGGRAELQEALGAAARGEVLVVEIEAGEGAWLQEAAHVAMTFGSVPAGATLVYVDSLGDLALADNQGSIAERLGLRAGQRVRIRARR